MRFTQVMAVPPPCGTCYGRLAVVRWFLPRLGDCARPEPMSNKEETENETKAFFLACIVILDDLQCPDGTGKPLLRQRTVY